MEFKVIIYIIIGIIYFLYTVGKKIEDKRKESGSSTDAAPPAKPVSPPTGNPLDDIMREVKRKQAEIEAQKKMTRPVSKPVPPVQKKPQKEILVREVRKAQMTEGSSDYEPVFERELTEEEKIPRGNIRLKNEGIYRVETMEEARTAADADANYVFNLDARAAFIGSVIFERKF